ncbi:hypothetical protein [Luteolibacter sp. AS25]|uniref:hypothetical protein n=1 Tax=Luteolibacter sp. AS25 TaxID=3135776 RepID=UPI00398B3BCE
MKILTSAAVCFTAVVLASCVDPNYYPPPSASRDFRPYGPEADRLRAEGRLNDDQQRYNTYDQSDRTDQGTTTYNQGYDQPRQQQQVDPVPSRDQYPTATGTANPNQVLSPYKPYNVIDIEGFRSGQLAKDPSNGQIFRIP